MRASCAAPENATSRESTAAAYGSAAVFDGVFAGSAAQHDAIDFYTSVFGARLVERLDGPNGTVAHAELDFGDGRLAVGDPAEAYQIAAPDPVAPVTHSIAFYCADVDAVVANAERAGATVREPTQPVVTGDRFASLLDPFGTRWNVMTRVEHVSPEERDRRLAEWAKNSSPEPAQPHVG
jgi:uncharacterized glyoxalase superfamily protein PhnB